MFNAKTYKRLGTLTWSFVFLLVLAGGLVRSTGSGMGCPDWPKCFEQWVPPTQESQLPDNYREIYSSKRAVKIGKFARLLRSLGMESKANELLTDKTLLIEEPFNARKTWTEYINRVLGAITGLLSILFVVSSFQFWKSNKKKVLTALLGLVLIAFNGWLGSIVVATNLLPGMVSIHFIFAFIAAAVVMVATHNGFTMRFSEKSRNWKVIILLALLVTLIQIVVGTLVRENVDYLTKTQASFRVNGLDESMMNTSLLVHKLWSWVFLVVNALIYWWMRKQSSGSKEGKVQLMILFVWGIQFVTGVLNIWYALPAATQLIHIVLGSAIFGTQLYLAIAFFNTRKTLERTN